ncbi:MAG: winged helix-turn-helix domain-containing protein [Myxococcales bacterium]|nr:winged helix-turn-helix domain-containing protein [Myxococcales bacterium]
MEQELDFITLYVGLADLGRLRVDRVDGTQRLTPIEGRLLAYLSAKSPAIASRQQLLEAVWGYTRGVRSRTVEATMHTLRAKIERDPARPDHVLTVRGKGYRFLPRRGDAVELLGALVHAPSLDPSLRAKLQSARASALAHDDPPSALALLDTLEHPSVDTITQRAGLLAAMGRLDEAAASLAEARRRSGDEARLDLELEGAGLDLRAGRWQEAQRTLAAASRSDGPIDLRAFATIRLGVLLLDREQPERGFAALEAARAMLHGLNAPRLMALAWCEEGVYRITHGPLPVARDALIAGLAAAARSQARYLQRVGNACLAVVRRGLGQHDEAERERRLGERLSVGRMEEPGYFAMLAIERWLAGDRDSAFEQLTRGFARHEQRPNQPDAALLTALQGWWTKLPVDRYAPRVRADYPPLHRLLFEADPSQLPGLLPRLFAA